MYIVANVDDMLIIRPSFSAYRVKNAISTVLTVKDLTCPQHFLSISITCHSNGMLLARPAYSERLFASAIVVDFKPTDTSLLLGYNLYGEREDASKEV